MQKNNLGERLIERLFKSQDEVKMADLKQQQKKRKGVRISEVVHEAPRYSSVSPLDDQRKSNVDSSVSKMFAQDTLNSQSDTESVSQKKKKKRYLDQSDDVKANFGQE